MFTHLDDPEPGPATAGWRRSVHQRVRTRRRRRRRAGLAAGGLFAVATVAAGAGLALDRRLQPEQVEVEGLAGQVDGSGRTVAVPAQRHRSGEPVTILFVGLDAAWDPGAGEAAPGSADTIVLARVDPVAGQVRLLPVPRDLWVSLSGTGADQKVNTSLGRGGPSLLVTTIRDELGVEVHHYVQADVAGAGAVVDAVGGVRLAVPHRVTSVRVGVDLPPGCRVLGGGEVVALGRARDLRVHDPAAGPEGRLDESADRGRQERTAVVAAALLQAVGRVGVDDLPALVGTGLREVVVDEGLDRDALVDLGRRAAAAEVVTYALPVEAASVGDQQVVRLLDGAGSLVTAFLDGTPPPGGEPGGEPAGDGGEPAGDATGLAPC